MRRKHQQTYCKRENTRDIPKADRQMSRSYFQKKEAKEKSTMENPEAVNRSIKAAEADMKSRKIRTIFDVVGLLVLIVLIGGQLLYHSSKEPEDKKENAIVRHYSEVLRRLDEDPEDISKNKYESNVPSIIQKDIDKMLEMGEDACVVYYNDEKEQLIIEPSEDSELGYQIRFSIGHDRYSTIDIEKPNGNISFYKAGETLVIYGTERGIRRLNCYIMDNEEINSARLEDDFLDLYGTGIEYDEVRYFNDYCTLIKIKNVNEFAMYHLGEKLYSTTFESGEVKHWSYYYIYAQNGDLYNVYYSTEKDNCWIKFNKVAENVNEILEDERVIVLDQNGYEMTFPAFKIGNKKYAQIPDSLAERTYGQNYGRNHGDVEEVEDDFTSQIVEISESNIYKVKLVMKLESWSGDIYEWYLYYYFQAGDRECYVKRTINGLDRKVSKVIPPSKLDMFNEKEISPDEVEEYINQLRKLYDEYTDNSF